jgi:hypothetical protein
MECLFSGDTANTKEHVIPDWIQKRMHIREQTLILPNKTGIKYKNLLVPASKSHNEKFGEIENRIASGHLEPNEAYLWALKIHIGLLYRDSTLRFNIEEPLSKPIINLRDYGFQVTIFRALYNCWRTGGNSYPAPFGSVFVIDSVTPNDHFDFMYCAYTGTIGIDVGSKFILVVLWDKSRTQNSNVLSEWHGHRSDILKKQERKADYEAHCVMALRIWAFETAYFAYQHRNESITIIQSGNSVAVAPDLVAPRKKELNDIEFSLICRNFGLERVDNPEIGQYVYTQRVV